RANRSRRPDLATRQYLINVTRRHRPRAVVLADMEGQVVAGVEGKPFMEGGFIAARAADRTSRAVAAAAIADFRADAGPTSRAARMIERLRSFGRRPARRDPALPDGARVAQAFSAGGRQFLMVVVGDEGGAVLTDALDGLRRILAEPMPALGAAVDDAVAVVPEFEAISPAEIRLRPATAH
ncbi:MAG: hypothetical protein H6701_17335, partial [Myxococcales bacterium]|nr:hypothetical protein [Myxococcales bacterium]